MKEKKKNKEVQKQLSCPSCNCSKLQLITLTPREKDTSLDLLCLRCGYLCSYLTSGSRVKPKFKTKKEVGYTG